MRREGGGSRNASEKRAHLLGKNGRERDERPRAISEAYRCKRVANALDVGKKKDLEFQAERKKDSFNKTGKGKRRSTEKGRRERNRLTKPTAVRKEGGRSVLQEDQIGILFAGGEKKPPLSHKEERKKHRSPTQLKRGPGESPKERATRLPFKGETDTTNFNEKAKHGSRPRKKRGGDTRKRRHLFLTGHLESQRRIKKQIGNRSLVCS